MRPSERRYYMRVIVRATTRCWGLIFAVGLLLPTAAPPAAAQGNVVPAAADTATKKPPFAHKWTVTLDGTTSAGLAVSSGHVHVIAAGDENAAWLETRARSDGKQTWRSDIAGWRTIIAGPDTVFGVAAGSLYALDATTGRQRWSAAVAGDQPRLTLEGEWLVVATSAEVRAYGAVAGGLAWAHTTPVATSAPIALDNQTAAVGYVDGSMAAYTLQTGAERWRIVTGSRPLALTAMAGVVFGGLEDGTFCAWRLTDGRVAWCHYLRVPIAGAPLPGSRFVHAAFRDNTLRTFDRRSGTRIRQRELGHRPSAGPEGSGDAMVLPLASGAFAVLDSSAQTLATVAPGTADSATQLLRTVVARDGQSLVSLTIPPGGQLTLVLYQVG